MEFILLLIGAGVAYFLYITLQDYLKNPLHPQEFTKTPSANPMPRVSFVDDEKSRAYNKAKESEYGILSAILGVFCRADGNTCEAERVLVEDMIDEMAKDSNNKISKENLLEIYNDASPKDLEQLCMDFNEKTKGEYKKRLKVVEFLFVLAYADNDFCEAEREMIIDIAAYFEIDNDDFNKIYDGFESLYAKSTELSKQEALEILGLKEGFSNEELESAYAEILKKTKGAVLDNKNISKTILEANAPLLQKIEKAYETLKNT